MRTGPETILLFNLSEAETQRVKSMVASSTIEIEPLSIVNLRSFLATFPEKKICLIIYHIEADRKHPHRVIQLIRDLAGPFVPLLLLIPAKKTRDVKRCISAGADDFMELPLNDNRFTISVLVLLEMGQAEGGEREILYGGKGEQKVANYFQEGSHYFSPRSILERWSTKIISNRWKQLKKLGAGGFGTVWLVREKNSGKLAVAKVPHSVKMNIKVLRAAAILKKLHLHPNIIRFQEIVKDNGKFVMIQEYVEGATLHQLVLNNISSQEKEKCFMQLLSGISYSHQLKIIHRDIKLENLIISKSGQLKILDFGMARDLSWQSGDHSSGGTVNFMAPEQFKGQSSMASDVWALGVILYILVTNTVPYTQQNDHYPMDIDTTLESRAPRKINPLLPSGLERIIMNCLRRDVNKRYCNAGELLEDLSLTLPDFGREITSGNSLRLECGTTPQRHLNLAYC